MKYSSRHVKKRVLPLVTTSRMQRIHALQKSSIHEYQEYLDVLKAPFDPQFIVHSELMVKKLYSNNLKCIFVVGIGGSSLGTKAIVSALPRRSGQPEIIFLESLESAVFERCEYTISQLNNNDEFVVCLISKAGGTTESIANFSVLLRLLEHIPGYAERVVAITIPKSPLADVAKQQGYQCLYIPERVSGRFSVFTHVGIFPLLLAGYPVVSVLEGARHAAASLGTPYDPTRRLTEDILSSVHEGLIGIDFFFFNSELEDLGKWSRQLYAESLGKEHDNDGREVHAGVFPTVTIGSVDLHSMVQLYFGGPKRHTTIFIPPLTGKSFVIPAHPATTIVPGVAGRTHHEINRAIYEGVKEAYAQHALPYVEMEFAALNAEMLGFYLQLHMQTVALLASAFHIEGFTQPNVEDYKIITKRILSKGL